MTRRDNLHTADLPLHGSNAFAAPSSGQSALSGSSDLNSRVASSAGRGRKAARIAVSLPVMVRDQFGGQHQARTQFVTVRGAVITTASTVRVGHKLTIQNLRSGRSAECHVTAMERAVKDTHEVEVEFTRPQPDFWPVQFPGDESRTQETLYSGSPIETSDEPLATNAGAPEFSSSIAAFSEPKPPRTVPHDDGIVVLADSLAENFSPSPTFRSQATFAPRTAPVDSVAQFRAANRAAHRRAQAMKTLYSIMLIIALGGVFVAGRAWMSHPSEIAGRLSAVSVLPKAKPHAPVSSEVSAPVAPVARASAIVPSPREVRESRTAREVSESPSVDQPASNPAAAAESTVSPEIANKPVETQVAVRHGSSLASSRKAVREKAVRETEEEPMALPLHEGDAANSATKPELLSAVVGQTPMQTAVLAPQVPKQMTPARLIYSAPAQYPSIARQLRTEGAVVLDLEVDPTGSVSTAKAVSGPAVLRTAALDAVKRWKYEPATLGGKPVSSTQTVKVDFRLK